MGKVTESIYDGATVVIPMADVSHILKDSFGIQVIMKHTTYNFEGDGFNNCVWIDKDEQEAFLAAWCRYRAELEAETLVCYSEIEYLEACKFVDTEIVKAEGLGRAVEILRYERDKLWQQGKNSMSIFKVGNTVRHKECYWGEQAYYIHKVTASGAHGIPTGSKHGKAWDEKSTCLIYEESEHKYKICPLYMRAWLWLLGELAEYSKG